MDDWAEKRNNKPFFVCKKCSEMIMKAENYSKDEGLCIFCYKELKEGNSFFQDGR